MKSIKHIIKNNRQTIYKIYKLELNKFLYKSLGNLQQVLFLSDNMRTLTKFFDYLFTSLTKNKHDSGLKTEYLRNYINVIGGHYENDKD